MQSIQQPDQSDVIVIGAGAAGLAAFESLRAAGLRAILLEARGRVGGRVYSRRLSDGSRVELGAQWLAGTGQDRLTALIDRHGLTARENHSRGAVVHLSGGERRESRSEDPLRGVAARLDAVRVILLAVWKSRRLRREFAAGADDRSVAEWLGRACWHADNRRFWTNVLEQALCCDLDRVSIYETLRNLRSVGGFAALASADKYYFSEGLQTIFEQQARRAGDALRLNAPVRAIEHNTSGVSVHTRNESFSADRAILCVPPQLAHRIECTPAWPVGRTRILGDFQLGAVVKCVGVYDRPFWRTRGYSGRVASPDATFEMLIDSGSGEDSPGVLVALVAGPRARTLNARSDIEKRAAFEEFVATAFQLKSDSARRPEEILREFYTHNWSEDSFALGAYSSRRGIGGWREESDELARPFGRLHFAGTETARQWRGYIEGALESGERAAREVTEAISRGRVSI